MYFEQEIFLNKLSQVNYKISGGVQQISGGWSKSQGGGANLRGGGAHPAVNPPLIAPFILL